MFFKSSKKSELLISSGLGYDHNYILRGSVAYDAPAGLQPVAKAAVDIWGVVHNHTLGCPPSQ